MMQSTFISNYFIHLFTSFHHYPPFLSLHFIRFLPNHLHFTFRKAMIFILFVLLFLVAANQALTWRYLRTGPSSPTSKIPAALVSSSSSRCFTKSPPRSMDTRLSDSKRRPPSSKQLLKANLDALEKKIRALEHLLKGGNSTTASEDIREFVLIYEGGDKEYLRGMLNNLQEEKTAIQSKDAAIQRKEAALQEEKTALAKSQGTLRRNRRSEPWMSFSVP